ncbi:hypothetical protein GQ600_24571 [Phytophthora cactorum]|nr:hypothetical protein GQ600_24571 [Phytophthora cactorum]
MDHDTAAVCHPEATIDALRGLQVSGRLRTSLPSALHLRVAGDTLRSVRRARGNVLVFRESKNRSNSSVRKGKWTGRAAARDGLHLRVFMANMLQCDPLRVTKNTRLQKQLSNLRNHYYWYVQYRCKFGPNLNIQELKAAEADYWIREFCKFAKKIGQKVEFTTVSAAGAEAPSISSLITRVPVVKVEDDTKLIAKGEEDSSAPSMKDGVSLMLGFASAMDQSPSPLSADAWNDPSAFVDLTLANLSQEELSKGDASLKPCAKDILKKGNWMNDWMKEAELEWSKGAISWSLSLSAEPLADFA